MKISHGLFSSHSPYLLSCQTKVYLLSPTKPKLRFCGLQRCVHCLHARRTHWCGKVAAQGCDTRGGHMDQVLQSSPRVPCLSFLFRCLKPLCLYAEHHRVLTFLPPAGCCSSPSSFNARVSRHLSSSLVSCRIASQPHRDYRRCTLPPPPPSVNCTTLPRARRSTALTQ
jgi:hypothetical protein